MKRICIALVLCFLTGCSRADDAMDRAISLRKRLLEGAGCSFSCRVTADYGKLQQQFSMDVEADAAGAVRFTVTAPDSIAGITGSAEASGGKLTFDDTVLMFDMLADGELSPVSAPWILVKALRSGNLRSAGTEGELMRITLDDRYEADAFQVDIWLEDGEAPVRGDILREGQRILCVEIENFRIV